MRVTRLATVLVVLVASAAGAGGPARAATPTVVVDRATARLGDRILVTLRDWPPRSSVVLSLCGNRAKRGTIDCDLERGSGLGLSDADTEHKAHLTITAPPVPCPCVVRVSDATQSTVLDAPIAIPELPTAPVVGDNYTSPLRLSVTVTRASDGLVGAARSWLGGRTSYFFTVKVQNRSSHDYPVSRLRARAGRGDDDQARLITIAAPGVIRSGQTWQHRERVTLAAPVIGDFVWTVSASGAGPVLKARATTDHVPGLLYLFAAALVADVAVIAYRWLGRRRPQLVRTHRKGAIAQ